MATITTKFERDQRVFFLKDNRVTADIIDFAVVSVDRWKQNDKWETTIEYALKEQHKDRRNPILHKEAELFATADELAESVRSQAEKL